MALGNDVMEEEEHQHGMVIAVVELPDAAA
jgi:hypothetical protein